MTVKIDCGLCNGCGGAKEPLCARVCPGGLLARGQDGKAQLREPEYCWDCAACMKECPQEAIRMVLPPEAGGRGSSLRARKVPGGVLWTLTDSKGNTEKIFSAAENVL